MHAYLMNVSLEETPPFTSFAPYPETL